MKTNWEALSKKLGVLREDGSEMYLGNNSSEALEEILGNEWLQDTLETFIEGKPGNELAIKTLRFISSPKAAAMAYKIYNDNKDTNQQIARLAIWALSDIRTEKSMDYAEEFIERSEYEGTTIAVVRNLIYGHIHLFTEEKILNILNKFRPEYKEDIEPLFEFVQKHFHPKKWYSLLDTIQKRPALYAIQKVEDIYVFWLGYSTGLLNDDLMDFDLMDFDKNFMQFIVTDFPSVPSFCNWCTAIRLYSTSDNASLELFFEALAKFKSGDENFDRVKFRENYRKHEQ